MPLLFLMPLLAQISSLSHRIRRGSGPSRAVPGDGDLKGPVASPLDVPGGPGADDLVSPIPRPPWSPPGGLRDHISREFIRGKGIEIGALWNPLRVPRGVRVTYVDRCDADGYREQLIHREDSTLQSGVPLVDVDVIDDAETLATMAPSSQEFIITNHLLEHTQNPIRTIQRHLEVLTPGGILFMAVPDKRLTFDVQRPVTSLEHLYRDYEDGPTWSFSDHVREWVELAEHKTGADVEARIHELTQESIIDLHFHVWTQDDLAEMLIDIRKRLALPFDIEGIVLNRPLVESICILRKTG